MSSTVSNVMDDEGSVSALRIALQTLGERCEKLQSQLEISEKENATFKSCCSCQIVNSQQEFSCTKQQLVEYLRIVTNENRTLWTKLSSLDNTVVNSNDDKIKPKNSLAIIDNYLKYNGMKEHKFII